MAVSFPTFISIHLCKLGKLIALTCRTLNPWDKPIKIQTSPSTFDAYLTRQSQNDPFYLYPFVVIEVIMQATNQNDSSMKKSNVLNTAQQRVF